MELNVIEMKGKVEEFVEHIPLRPKVVWMTYLNIKVISEFRSQWDI